MRLATPMHQRTWGSSSGKSARTKRCIAAYAWNSDVRDISTTSSTRSSVISSGSISSTIDVLPRRAALMTPLAVLMLSSSPAWGEEAAVELASQAPSASSVYINNKQKYSMSVPADWEKKEKMGADALFEDPARRSSTLGVTVNPVKVKSIQDFGPLDLVGEKLLQSERNKESTLEVHMVRSSTRTVPPLGEGAANAAPVELYDFEYEIDSTRGLKRIINTVTIYRGQLYIMNGNYKCEKTGCETSEQEAVMQQLRDAAASFRIMI